MPDDSLLAASHTPPPAPAPLAPVARWRWAVHLLLIGAYPLWIGAAGWGDHEGAPPALASTTDGILWASSVGLLLFALLFGAAWLASRATRDDLLLRWRPGFWVVPLGLGYSIALRIAVGLVAVTVGVAVMLIRKMSPQELQSFIANHAPKVEALVDVTAMRDNPAYFWLTVTFVSFVVAGLREELWRAAFLAGMRALWPRQFSSRAAQVGGVAIAALVFGLGHAIQGPIAATAAGLLGFGLGLIMLRHRSIWPAVIAHGCFDAASFTMIPLMLEKLQTLKETLPH